MSIPNVVAVIVTRNPGPWFEDTLASLATQDHPNLSILVLDDGSIDPVTARVAAVVPSAFVRRHDTPIGSGAAANQVLEMVQGAAYYLFCHDDVALAPDAVRLLVSEAESGGFDLLGPKIVTWNDHERLLSVGLSVDRAGSTISLVEPFELDQGQHDAVREITSMPGAAFLARAASFAALEGFDPTLTAPPTTARAAFVRPRSRRPSVVAGSVDDLSRPEDDDADARLAQACASGPDVGEDIDLSWRARQQGMRLGVQPAARAAHAAEWHGLGVEVGPGSSAEEIARVEAAGSIVQRTRERNRIRSMLTTASGVRVPFVLPLLAMQSLWRSRQRSRTPGGSAAGLRAWRGVFDGLGATRRQRRKVQRRRSIGERELLRPLAPVASRARAALRADVTADGARAWNVAERTVANDSVPARIVAIGALVGTVVLLVGSRRIVFGSLPRVGQFAPIPPVGTLWRLALSGWRDVGVGIMAPAPPALWLLSILGTVFLGATGLLQTVMTVGMLPIGLAGMWQLAGAAARLGSRDEATRGPGRHGNAVRVAQVTATFAYGVTPLGYDSIAHGRLDGCIAVGLVPWLVRALLRAIEDKRQSDQRSGDRRSRATGRAPAVEVAVDADRPGGDRRNGDRRRERLAAPLRPRSLVISALRLAVPLAAAASLAPGLLIGMLVAAVGLVAGTALLGEGQNVRALALRSATGAIATLVLLAPWSADLLRSGAHAAILTGGDQAVTLRATVLDLLRLNVGPVGASPFGWLLLIAASFPLFVADGARFRGAVRAWGLIVTSVAAVWLAGRGWLGLAMANPSVALAPAGVGIALAAGLGIAGFVADARARRFGWRQVFAAASLVTIAAAAAPVVAASIGGRWNLPERDLGKALGWLPDEAAAGPFRTIWIGSPSVLPAASWRTGPDLAFTLSENGLPDATDQWGSRRTAGIDALADDLNLVLSGRTNRHGAELADWGVRYVVLVARAAPRAPAHPLSIDVRRGFTDQLDLRQIESETGLTVYENTAWSPVRLVLPILADSGVRSGTLSPTDLLRSQAAFLGPRHDRTFSAIVNPGSALVFRSSFDSSWKLSIGGRSVSPIPLDVGGMAFVPASSDGSTNPVRATVSYRDGRVHWLVVVMQMLLWLSAIAALVVAKANRQPNREALLLAQERLEAATAIDSEDDVRFGDPFRTSFVQDGDRGFGIDADFAHPPETDDAFAAFDAPVRTGDRSTRRSARPSRAPRAAGRSAPSAPRPSSTTERVEPTVSSLERTDLPEDGSLADELWERWMRRRGGDAPLDNDDV